jgi:hypothetical protein
MSGHTCMYNVFIINIKFSEQDTFLEYSSSLWEQVIFYVNFSWQILCTTVSTSVLQEWFFSVIQLISAIFLWKLISESCWTRLEQVKNYHFESYFTLISVILQAVLSLNHVKSKYSFLISLYYLIMMHFVCNLLNKTG